MNQHKITIRVFVKEYIIYILSDLVIRTEADCCLKILPDLSVENMQTKEVEEAIC